MPSKKERKLCDPDCILFLGMPFSPAQVKINKKKLQWPCFKSQGWIVSGFRGWHISKRERLFNPKQQEFSAHYSTFIQNRRIKQDLFSPPLNGSFRLWESELCIHFILIYCFSLTLNFFLLDLSKMSVNLNKWQGGGG